LPLLFEKREDIMAKNKNSIIEEVTKPIEEKEEVKEEYIEEVLKPTTHDLVTGASPEVKIVKVVDYTSHKRIYKVHNIAKDRTYTLNGYEIGAILGMNETAKKELKEGAKKVTLKEIKRVNDEYQTIEKYHIEVIK
jgi:hypothetical protein